MPRATNKIARRLAVLAAILLCCIISDAQDPVLVSQRERGIELYEEGDPTTALIALNLALNLRKDDAETWYYIGLVHYSQSEIKQASKAFEKAMRLNANIAPGHPGLAFSLLLEGKSLKATGESRSADNPTAEAVYMLGVIQLRAGNYSKALENAKRALTLDRDFAPALLLKALALSGTDAWAVVLPRDERFSPRMTRVAAASESLERYFQLKPDPPVAELIRDLLNNLRLIANEKAASQIDQPPSVVTGEVLYKAEMDTEPEPAFTEQARKKRRHGTVVLRVLFASDGKVKYVRVLSGLPDGLTENSIWAARRIKFIPATKNGRPVSQWTQLEYTFNVY